MEPFAVVLGAGGPLASLQHLGLLGALEARGVQLAEAQRVVATSAGAGIAAGVLSGAGLEQTRRWATTPPSAEDRARFRAAMTAGGLRRWPPLDPLMVRHLAAGPRGLNLALTGMLPGGRLPTSAMSRFLEEAPPIPPGSTVDGWPDGLWVPAVRVPDGRRVVLGRDRHPSLADALEATAAVPGFFLPKRIGDERFVDGAVVSANSADLAAGSGASLVLVSSVQTREGRSPFRQNARATLRREVDGLERAGMRVLVLEPGPAFSALAAGFPRRGVERAPALLEESRAAAERVLAAL